MMRRKGNQDTMDNCTKSQQRHNCIITEMCKSVPFLKSSSSCTQTIAAAANSSSIKKISAKRMLHLDKSGCVTTVADIVGTQAATRQGTANDTND